MNIPRPQLTGEDSDFRWLFLDLNSFFSSCEQQERPEWRDRPLIVVPMLADTTCAIAASYRAKAFGIKTGTPVGEARARCPDLIVVPARPKLYVEYHHRVLAAIDCCIPIDEVMSVDEVACRLDRTQQNEERAHRLASLIKTTIKNQVGICMTSSVGVSSNKLLAKLASDMQKPDGLTFLNHKNLPAAILHLDLEAMPGIGANMALRLRRAGIHDMASLWNADGQRLKSIWGGVMGLRFHTFLHGGDLVSPKHPRRSLGHQHVLAPSERCFDKATPVLRQLLVRAAQRLRTDRFYCRRLFLDIKWAHHLGSYTDEARFQETQDTGFLLNVLKTLWHKAPSMRPLRIGVMLLDLVPETDHQLDLFDKPKSSALTQAVDQLNLKYGRGTIVYGLSVEDMVSKIAFQRVPDLSEF